MVKNCLNCGKEYKTCKFKSKYCSKACSNSGTKKNTKWKNPPGSKKIKKRICLRCGKEFYARFCYVKRGQYKYCSNKCAAQSPLRKLNLSHRKNFKHSELTKLKMSFSSIGKHSGEKCSFWHGGVWKKQNYGFLWNNTLRRIVRERDNYLCQVCFNVGNSVHHINYDKDDCCLGNLVNLCKSCHAKTNINRIYWELYFMIKKFDLIF
jgi:hypothetical protein